MSLYLPKASFKPPFDAHCISEEQFDIFLRPLGPMAQFSLFQKAKFKRAFVYRGLFLYQGKGDDSMHLVVISEYNIESSSIIERLPVFYH